MYNPSGVGKKGSIFGLPYSVDESSLVIIPVNLDVTTSYIAGTAYAPQVILEESAQLDFSIPDVNKPWLLRMAMDDQILNIDDNKNYRKKAEEVIGQLENGLKADEVTIEEVNSFCEEVHQKITERCSTLLDQGKCVAIVGGDHSSPLGLMRALGEKESFGILQIDAHMDLRSSYEGFTYSHASIMYHAIQMEHVSSLTQVGIRDYCEEEESFIKNIDKPIHVFYDEKMSQERYAGRLWSEQVDEIVETLPEQVYISFDIDGLNPSLCPNTGTPVPGGLEYNQVIYLLNAISNQGKRIVGFDVCEVGNQRFDANVGARIIYRLSVSMLSSV